MASTQSANSNDSRVEELNKAVEDIRARIRAATSEIDSGEAVEELQQAVSIAMEEMSDLQSRLEVATRKNPMLALGGALAVGYMLGNLFSKK
ncbi:hypothetical protein HK107_02025 [Parvularcula sp. ZS-1/3]|uniref:DUF883 domain-containing protein n=1 Tax=Parvularcula mediterranea TaxID=2732508 RepID=A0A7Y3RK96_9PROT|nr:hypothetical protein [Parvularcula mediterranea]NNU15101.1 hypothetical protein [Parvularcula mediterranea]